MFSLIRYFLIVTALLLSIQSCSKRYQDLPAFVGIPFEDAENYSVGRFKTSYMADQIHAYFRGNAAGPIAVTTFVEIDNLYQSSTFGRILAEQLISELSMRGYNVIEIRMSDAVQIIEDQGELGLSRENNVIRGNQDISGLVVGTYAVSPNRVYVNSRLIDPKSSGILSVGSVEMKKTDEIATLLRTNSFPTSLERIPVRHINYQNQAPLPVYFENYGSSSMGLNTHGEEFAKKLALDTGINSSHAKLDPIVKDEVLGTEALPASKGLEKEVKSAGKAFEQK